MSWQGYGPSGQPGYPTPGQYPGPPPPSRPPGNTGLVVLIVALAAVAVVIFGGAGVWVAMSDDDRAKVTAPRSPAPGTGPAESPGTSPSAGSAGTPVRQVRPKVRGWQGVASEKYKLAYDAPRSWKVNAPGVIIGFEERKGGVLAAMSSTSEFKKGFCASSRTSARAAVGFNGYVDTALAPVASDAARKWAVAAYKPDGGREPTLSLTGPRAFTVGGMKAVQVTAQATVHSSDTCDPPRGVAHAVAMKGRGTSKTTVFVVWADQSVADQASSAEIRKMIGSLRPLS